MGKMTRRSSRAFEARKGQERLAILPWLILVRRLCGGLPPLVL